MDSKMARRWLASSWRDLADTPSNELSPRGLENALGGGIGHDRPPPSVGYHHPIGDGLQDGPSLAGLLLVGA